MAKGGKDGVGQIEEETVSGQGAKGREAAAGPPERGEKPGAGGKPENPGKPEDPGKPDDPGGHDGDHGPRGPKKVEITAVVNGQPTETDADRDELLSSVRERVLRATNNVAQPPENWEFKDEAGVALDTAKTVGEFGFGKRVTLFLSLRAGVAGA